MIKNKKILAVIPARGGSKGVKLKNLLKIQGISITSRATLLASKLNVIDKVLVSSDNDKILKDVSKINERICLKRPSQLSGDRVSDIRVLKHALQMAEKREKTTFDLIVMLQPTSPMRSKHEVLESINIFIENNHDSVWSVSGVDLKYHPYKQLWISNSNQLKYFDENKGEKIIARQQLRETYYRNGAVYVLSRNLVLSGKSLMGKNPGFFKSKKSHISIDNKEEFIKVKGIIEKK